MDKKKRPVGYYELARRIAPKTGLTQADAKFLIKALVSEIKLAVEHGETVSLYGFVKFDTRRIAGRVCNLNGKRVNPRLRPVATALGRWKSQVGKIDMEE